MMKNSIVSDLEIQAFLDGEVDGEEEKRIQAVLQINAICKARYMQLKMQKDLIVAAWQEDFSGKNFQ